MKKVRDSAGEKQKSGLVADDGNMSFAGCDVFELDQVTGMQLSRFAVGRGDGEYAPQHREELDRRRGVIEMVLQIVSAPVRAESRYERP